MHRKVSVRILDLFAIFPGPCHLVISFGLLCINIPWHDFTGCAGLPVEASISDLNLYFIIRAFNDELSRGFFRVS